MNMEATSAIMVRAWVFLSAAHIQRKGNPNARSMFFISASTVKQVHSKTIVPKIYHFTYN